MKLEIDASTSPRDTVITVALTPTIAGPKQAVKFAPVSAPTVMLRGRREGSMAMTVDRLTTRSLRWRWTSKFSTIVPSPDLMLVPWDSDTRMRTSALRSRAAIECCSVRLVPSTGDATANVDMVSSPVRVMLAMLRLVFVSTSTPL